MKKLLVLLAILLVITGFAGCNKKEKEYTDGTIVLKLTDDFEEQQDDEYDYSLQSGEVLILCSHADKKFLEENSVSDITLDEFTRFFSEGETLLLDRKFKGYNVFSYEAAVSNTTYYYLIGVYETNDGFWLVNFVCDTSDTKKYEAKFLDWAGQVTFK